MRITKTIVKNFEQEQAQFGTKVALENIIWQLCYSLLSDIGVTKLSVSYNKKKR